MGKKILNKIKVTPLKIIKLSAGNIMKALNKNELKNWSFGEAYFSKIKFGKIKAWKYHKKMMLNLVVPLGRVKFIFYSEKENKFKKVEIGEKKYLRLTVPSKIWFGFKGIGKPESIILNITNIKHDPKEILRRKKSEINFNW
jgi:dTDP-4-dehydrorhamnose 3,5-epimerase